MGGRWAVVAVALCGCAPPLSSGEARVYRGVPYDPAIPERTLDLIVPAGPGPAPLVVYFHGGGWWAGSSRSDIAGWTWLVDRGYALASVNYRLSGEARFPAQLEDCRAAVRVLRRDAERWGVDGDRVALAGFSAGGHLAALLGLTPGDPASDDGTAAGVSDAARAVVAMSGPYDLEPIHTDLDDSVAALLGAPFASAPARFREANPIALARADAPPFLLVHGDEDTAVPISEAVAFAGALGQAGARVELLRVENAGHGLVPTGGAPQPSLDEVHDQIDAFLRANLGLAPGQ